MCTRRNDELKLLVVEFAVSLNLKKILNDYLVVFRVIDPRLTQQPIDFVDVENHSGRGRRELSEQQRGKRFRLKNGVDTLCDRNITRIPNRRPVNPAERSERIELICIGLDLRDLINASQIDP